MPALTGTVRAAGSTEPLAGAQVWAYRTVLWLERPLNAYEAPDTKSKVLGTLLPGVHPVSEIRFGRAIGLRLRPRAGRRGTRWSRLDLRPLAAQHLRPPR